MKGEQQQGNRGGEEKREEEGKEMQDVRREVEEIGQVKRMGIEEEDQREEIIIEKSQEEEVARVMSGAELGHCLSSCFYFTPSFFAWFCCAGERRRRRGR